MCITLLPDFVTNKYCLVRGSAGERKKPERGREEGKEDEKGERREEEGRRGREISHKSRPGAWGVFENLLKSN